MKSTSTKRRVALAVLAATYPVFFLLYWNGLFYQTYYWALELVDGTRKFGPQVTLAFISSVIIYGILYLVIDCLIWPRKSEATDSDM